MTLANSNIQTLLDEFIQIGCNAAIDGALYDTTAKVLTGENKAHYSDASGTLLLDVAHKCWSREMLEICHITEDMLPKLFESYQAIGIISRSVAQALGLPETVKIAAGAGDNAAAAVGSGTIGDGKCNISLGTSGTIFVSSDTFHMDQHNALHAFAHADGKYHLMGCMLSAAACNQWWTEQILQTEDYTGEQQGICTLGKNSVYFLPYLMGERSPHNNPRIRSMFLGMSLDTSRAQMTQAVMEGVAYGLRDSLEVVKSLDIDAPRATICGGGAKSSLWKKIIANVLNIPIDTVLDEGGAGLGSVMFAAVACGQYADLAQACRQIVRVTETVEPDKELAAAYEQGYHRFRQLYPAVEPLFG